MLRRRSYEIDMCSGALLPKIFRFAVPLMLSGVLQLLFNAVDIVVVGRFSGSTALAAVGSTTSLINLLVNLFIGLSIGVNVLVARFYGAHADEDVRETVHTAMLTAVYAGIVMAFVGFLLAKPLLSLMGTPADVIDQSVLYMRIYFMGMPAFMVYNFGAAILRAVGDTQRPLYFLLAAGVVNVVFNLFFVIVFGMGVDGVAIATVISQALSAVLVLICLQHTSGPFQLELSRMRIHRNKLLFIFKVGIPAGLQSIMFSISNVLIQSSINSFGPMVMAGNTAAANIEGFVYTADNAIYQTGLSFTSQNMGAKQYHRIDRILGWCLLLSVSLGIALGVGSYLIGDVLLGLYSTDPEVIAYGLIRMSVVCALSSINNVMDVVAGVVRGMGFSFTPMLVSLTGVCVFRVFWVFAVFPVTQTLLSLYISYPISWTITSIIHLICFFYLRRKHLKPAIEKMAQIQV